MSWKTGAVIGALVYPAAMFFFGGSIGTYLNWLPFYLSGANQCWTVLVCPALFSAFFIIAPALGAVIGGALQHYMGKH